MQPSRQTKKRKTHLSLLLMLSIICRPANGRRMSAYFTDKKLRTWAESFSSWWPRHYGVRRGEGDVFTFKFIFHFLFVFMFDFIFVLILRLLLLCEPGVTVPDVVGLDIAEYEFIFILRLSALFEVASQSTNLNGSTARTHLTWRLPSYFLSLSILFFPAKAGPTYRRDPFLSESVQRKQCRTY